MDRQVLHTLFEDELTKKRTHRCTEQDNYCEEAKFLSRLFAIFSEGIVRIWGESEQSKYKGSLGRPTIYTYKNKRYTLDFTFEDQAGKIYIVEMKAELQYEKFKYMVLKNRSEEPKVDFLNHHLKKEAFKLFINPNSSEVREIKVNGESKKVDGSILIWGSISKNFNLDLFNKEENIQLHDILSVENMIDDLIASENKEYFEFVGKYRQWSGRLFDTLTGKVT